MAFTRACLTLALCLCASAFAQTVTWDGKTAAATLTQTEIETKGFPSSLHFQLEMGGVEINDSASGLKEVWAKGLVPNVRPGEPAVPVRGEILAAPEGFEPIVTVTRHEERTVPQVWVAPYWMKSRCNPQPSQQWGGYQTFNVYPEQLVTLAPVGRLQSLRLYRLGIHPVRADMDAGQLKVSRRLEFKVTWKAKGDPKVHVLPPSLFNLVRSVAANGKTLGERVVPRSGAEVAWVVVPDGLRKHIRSLEKWYQYRGIRTVVIPTSKLGTTPDQVQQQLARYYQKGTKPSYLLMVGDHTQVPAFVRTVTFGNQQAVTDYPYTLLEGADAIPDLLVGRIIAGNKEELKRQIYRWVQYEATPERGGTWYKRGITLASHEGSSPSDADYARGIAKVLTKGGFTEVDTLLEGKQSATFANFSRAMTGGRSWVQYFGHGSGTSWSSTNDNISTRHLATLNNLGRLPVVFDVACQNGNYRSYQPCFGKQWVTGGTSQRNAGAVAYYGGSVNISWHPPAIMATGIARSHFEKKVPTVGGSALAGQLYLIAQIGLNNQSKDNLTWYNLMGNPAMQLRTRTPTPYQVQTQVRERQGYRWVLAQATDAGGRGVRGLTAAAHTPNEWKARDIQTTDAYGRAYLKVKDPARSLFITLTGPNAETYRVPVK